MTRQRRMDRETWERLDGWLRGRGVTKPCPRCGHEEFSWEGFTRIPLYDYADDTQVADTVTLLVLSCTQCRSMTTYGIGPGETFPV